MTPRFRRGPTRGEAFSALADFLGGVERRIGHGAVLSASSHPTPSDSDPFAGPRPYVDRRRRDARVPEVLVIASGSRARLVSARSRAPLGPPLPRAQALAIARALRPSS